MFFAGSFALIDRRALLRLPSFNSATNRTLRPSRLHRLFLGNVPANAECPDLGKSSLGGGWIVESPAQPSGMAARH